METATSVEMPRCELSRAKRSLLEKRLRGAFRCSWSRRSTPRQRGAAIVPLQPHGSKPPLILAHGAGGGLLWGYRNLAAQLDTDQPVYAIEPRSLGNWRALRTVEDMASAYLQELQQLQKNGPYYLGGYCFGGLIAYEMARQLWLRCERVGALLLIDAAAPNGIYHQLHWWRPRFLLDFTRNCFYWLHDFRHLETNAKHKFIRRKLAVGGRKLLRRLRRQPWWPGSRCESSPDRLDLEEFIDPEQFPDNELELWKIHLQAEIEYRPRPYPGHVVLLRTRGQPLFCSFDPHFGWGELAGAVTVKMLPGAHERIFEEPRVADLGQTLRACLGTSVSQS